MKQLDLSMQVEEAGLIDVDEKAGRLKTSFCRELTRDLGLCYEPEHWDEGKLAAWLCRQLHDPYITHASKRAFVASWFSNLLETTNFTLSRANSQKFLLRNLLAEQIVTLRKRAVNNACGEFLFGEGKEERVRVGSEYCFEFHPDAYAPTRKDAGEYGDYYFQNHYYPSVGAEYQG